VITGGIPSPCKSPTGPAPPVGSGGGGTSESIDGKVGGAGSVGGVSPKIGVTGTGFIAFGSELSGIFENKET